MAFEETLNFQLKFSEQGIDQVAAKFQSIFSKFQAEAANTGAPASQLTSQFTQASAAYVRQARELVKGLPDFQQSFGNQLVTNLATKLKGIQDKLVSDYRDATSPQGISAQVTQALAARNIAAQKTIVENSRLLGEPVPAQTFTNQGGLTGGSTAFVSTEESLQQKEAYAAVTTALTEARAQIAQFGAIQKRGLESYAAEIGEAAADDRIENAAILTAKRRVLSETVGYASTVAEGTIVQREIDSRIAQEQNRRLLGIDVAGNAGAGSASASEAQARLAASSGEFADSIDAEALKIREGGNAVSEAMQKARTVLQEFSVIEGLPGGLQAFAAEEGEAAFKLKALEQAITTETVEREAGSSEYKGLVQREAAARAKLTEATNVAAANLETSNPNSTFFQRLQASFFNRYGSSPREASSFPQLGQFVGQKALTTAGFAVSGAAFYGTYQGIRQSVTEANALQVALVNLQEEFKAADDAGDFPKARQAILDLSNESGIAASEIAQITTTFKGAFGDTSRAIQETAESVQLVVATGLSLSDVTNNVLAIDEAFGVTSKTIGDVTLSLQELTGVSAKETITALGAIAPVADQVGLSFKETATLLTVSEQLTGRSATTIAENFSRILPAIQKNGVAILDLIGQVPKLGSQYQKLGKDLNTGSEGKFLTDLAQVYGKLTPVVQNTIDEALGGRREAGTTITFLQNYSKYADTVGKVTDNNGKTAKYAAEQYATLSRQLSVLRAELQNFIGDLLRGGLASGLTELAKGVGIILGGFQQMEIALKSINQLSHGLAGDAVVAGGVFAGIKYGGSILSSARRTVNIGETTGLNASAAALDGAATNLDAAALALRASAAGEAVPAALSPAAAAAGSAAAGAGAGAAAGPEVTDIFGGATGSLEGFGLGSLLGTGLASLPLLPIAGTALAGLSLYRLVAQDVASQNAKAKEAADKLTKSFLDQRADLDKALLGLIAGNKSIPIPAGLSDDAIAKYANTQKLLQQSKDLKDVTAKLTADAQAQYIKQHGTGFNSAPLDSTHGGPLGGPTIGPEIIDPGEAARVLSHIPGLGFLGHTAVSKIQSQGSVEKAVGQVGKDVRARLTTNVLIPFIDQYIKDVQDGTAKGLIDPQSDIGKGLTDTGQLLAGLTNKSDDPASKEVAKRQAKEATDTLKHIKKLLGDGSNAKNYQYALAYIDSIQNNPGTSDSSKTVVDQVKHNIDQLQRELKSTNIEADLATQQQLVAAGGESYTLYITNLEKEIDGLLSLQDDAPLTPQLKLELAQDQKQESDTIDTLATTAQQNADFLVSLSGNVQDEAQGKLQDALVKLRTLPKNDPNRVQAAQDVITAAQGAYTQQLLGESNTAAAFQQSLGAIPLPPDAVSTIVNAENHANDALKAYLKTRIAFYKTEIARLIATETGGATKQTEAAIASATADLNAASSSLNYLNSLPSATAASVTASAGQQTADAVRAKADALGQIAAGQDPVAQAQAAVNAALRKIAEDSKYDKSQLAQDFLAYQQAQEQAAGALNDVASARLALAAAETQDPVEQAKIAIEQADLAASQAHGDAAKLQAQAQKVAAQHQLADALSAEKDSLDQLLIAVANFYGDIVKASDISVAEALRHLQEAIKGKKGKTAIQQAYSAYVDALASNGQTVIQSQEDTIQFNLDLNKISVTQAIAEYQDLLKGVKNIQTQRDILEKINSLKQSLNQNLQFNLPSDLQLPTLYEARRFVQGGGANSFLPQSGASQFNDNRQITIEVSGAGNPSQVAAAVVSALNTPTRYGVRPRILR